MAKYEPLNKFLKNTRRHRRFPVAGMDIRVQSKAEAETGGPSEDYKVISINLGGALIEGESSREQETKLCMELFLPENVRISLTGRVTSCSPAKTKESRYDIGIEFISMTELDRNILKKFIQWLYLKDAGFTE